VRGDERPAAKWNPEKVDDDWQIGRVRQVLHRPLAIFSVIGPSFAIWSRCPGGNQDFSQFLSFCEPLLGYSLIIGINVFSHERILRTVVV